MRFVGNPDGRISAFVSKRDVKELYDSVISSLLSARSAFTFLGDTHNANLVNDLAYSLFCDLNSVLDSLDSLDSPDAKNP